MTDDERDKAKHEGVWQFVSELDPFRVKLICLTNGRRATMLKREIDPLEQAAREWADSKPGEYEIGNCKQEAYEIMLALFADVQAPADLAPKLRLVQAAPADYDDSEIALGKQRLAQLERLEAHERERTVTECNTHDEQAPDPQQPADAWREF